MKTDFRWVTHKAGIGNGAALQLNGVTIAEVSVSGGWGWCELYLGALRPEKLTNYHRTVQKAMASVEKHFGIPRIVVKA